MLSTDKETELKDILIKWGQYRDVMYINRDNEIETKRCLVVPATEIERLPSLIME